jgi:hypothetical protein
MVGDEDVRSSIQMRCHAACKGVVQFETKDVSSLYSTFISFCSYKVYLYLILTFYFVEHRLSVYLSSHKQLWTRSPPTLGFTTDGAWRSVVAQLDAPPNTFLTLFRRLLCAAYPRPPTQTPTPPPT